MAVCLICGRDPEEVQWAPFDPEAFFSVHECHCVREDGVRVAIGICCGREIGPALLREEDYHDKAPWRVESDCTCSKK